MKLHELIHSLRAIADFYEAHPDFPLPTNDELRAYSVYTPDEAKKQVAAFLEGAGKVMKEAKDGDDYIRLVRYPDGLKFLLSVEKDSMGCRKVQHERVVVEEKWECGPILNGIHEKSE